MSADYSPLWYWVTERESIRQKKEAGFPRPWTTDPILVKYRFCNVRREDDRVTKWVDEWIRKPFAQHPDLWFMLCLARQINWPDTLQELRCSRFMSGECWPDDPGFTPQKLGEGLNALADQGKKVFTGAYIVTAPPTKGAKKTTFVAEQTLGQLWRQRQRFQEYFGRTAPDQRRLREVHHLLTQYKGWGPFLAYQAVVDMRFTRLLDQAIDREQWAASGPGTLRGLNRLHGRRVDFALPQDRARVELREIFARATSETGVPMDFSDVPNILCETDKYLRVKNGEGEPRALYVPGRGC